MKKVKRSKIYYADLSLAVGSEQDGTRPVFVIQNDAGNKFSPTTIVAAITSKSDKAMAPKKYMSEMKTLAICAGCIRTLVVSLVLPKGEILQKGMGRMTVTDISREPQKPEIIRLAAYCRVSSKSTDQLHSFAAQICYYKDYERMNPQYKLVDVYADEGLSGVDMKKRDEQNRLIRDCKLGKIDRIITKSVSRFARNTQELLVALRSLKEMGISIYFEEQGIDSDKMNMEMLVTFPGMAAQQESVNISDHLRRSYQMRMESGEFNCNAPAYGFEIVDGQLVVKEGEAQIIRRIFDLYLQGIGKQNIANILNAEGIPRRYAQERWYHSTVNYVISIGCVKIRLNQEHPNSKGAPV